MPGSGTWGGGWRTDDQTIEVINGALKIKDNILSLLRSHIFFGKKAIGNGSGSQAMVGMDGTFSGYIMPRAGTITAFGLRFTNKLDAGDTVSIFIYINAVEAKEIIIDENSVDMIEVLPS